VTAVLAEVDLGALVTVRGPRPAEAAGRLVLALGPDEWLVAGAGEDDFPDADAAVDVSAAYRCLELAGPGAPAVLAQGCSVEVGVGESAATLLARAGVVLHRPEEERFRILVRPSFAPYLRAWLEEALTSLRASR